MAAGYHGAGERYPANNMNDGTYGEAKAPGMAPRANVDRYPVPRLLEILAKEAEALIVELNELREQLAPLMGPEPALNFVSEAHVPPAASPLGGQIAHVSNVIYSAHSVVRSIKAQLDL